MNRPRFLQRILEECETRFRSKKLYSLDYKDFLSVSKEVPTECYTADEELLRWKTLVL